MEEKAIKKVADIKVFKGDYAFLSNSFPCTIEIDGLVYSSAEAAFWAQRVKDEKARRKYTRLNPNKAREKGMQAEPIDDWEDIKLDVLMKVLKIKFSDPELKEKLLSTGNAKLINTNTYRDEYYGMYLGKGRNKLGVTLMSLRDELKG